MTWLKKRKLNKFKYNKGQSNNKVNTKWVLSFNNFKRHYPFSLIMKKCKATLTRGGETSIMDVKVTCHEMRWLSGK